jgi:hypothetical protein
MYFINLYIMICCSKYIYSILDFNLESSPKHPFLSTKTANQRQKRGIELHTRIETLSSHILLQPYTQPPHCHHPQQYYTFKPTPRPRNTRDSGTTATCRRRQRTPTTQTTPCIQFPSTTPTRRPCNHHHSRHDGDGSYGWDERTVHGW